MTLLPKLTLSTTLALLINSSTAFAASASLSKRSSQMSTGATAGLGIGIAIAGLIVIAVCVLLVLHFRQRKSKSTASAEPSAINTSTDTEKQQWSPSLSAFTTTSDDSDAPKPVTNLDQRQSNIQPAPPRRQKSLKDRLKGPLYHGTQRDGPSVPLPAHVRRSVVISALPVDRTDSDMDEEYRLANDGVKGPVKSYSSRRATRLMMYM